LTKKQYINKLTFLSTSFQPNFYSLNFMEYKEPKYGQPQHQNKPLFPKLGIQLNCPKCSHEIIADDLNIDKAIAKCKNCNNVFTFEESVTSPMRRRKEVFLPEEIEIDAYQDELTLFYKWRKAKGISPFLIFFGVIWNAMIIPFVIGAIMSGSLAFLLGISLHLMVGVSFIIYILTRLMNTTYITVDDYELSIEHRPFTIPFIAKNQYYNVQDIEQLYSKKYVSHQTNGVNIYAYAVHAQIVGGEDIKIIGGFKQKNKALFIEQEIELFLGVKDKKVAGEIPH
jgi:hypothetical protein